MCILEDILDLSGQSAEQPDVTFMFALVCVNHSDDHQVSQTLKKSINSE